METNTTRRASFKRIGIGLAALFGVGSTVSARAMANGSKDKKEVVGDVVTDQDVPLFSGAVKHGNTLYVAGKGAHVEPFEIKAHTEIVLNALERELKKHGSSMDKVLKVNVYLADLNDYHAMNEVYRGRFGKNPPVRTTVATYGGVPGDSLVEIDCIAALD
ncbi:RidA family protein [Flagellimonas sp.]|uniref:RidA family protein n=1 Tax=Flagellimonas sp. TaxID=2058762 RepID=UPI0034B8EF9C